MAQTYITKDDLSRIGITLNDHEADALLQHANDTLQERIGVEITNSLNDRQIDQMLSLQEENNEQRLQDWLTVNVPNLQDIVIDEIDILLGEIAESHKDIVEAQ